MHFAKYKRGAVGHMLCHYDRTAAGHSSDIDVNRSFDNYNLCDSKEKGIDRLRACVGNNEIKGWAKCQQRADVNVLCDWVVTMPKDLAAEYEKDFFKNCYEYLANKYGVNDRKNIISAFVHKDEVTPHMHFAFVPLVADKKKNRYKVSAKEAVTIADLRTIHKNMQEYLCQKLGVQVNLLNGATRFGNRTIEQLKAETAHKEAEAKEYAAAAEKEIAGIKAKARFRPAVEPGMLRRLFGAEAVPAKFELSQAVYKKLLETAKTGAEANKKLSSMQDNAELVKKLNKEVAELKQKLKDEVSELNQQFYDELCQLRQQLKEKDQRIEHLLKVEDKYKRIEKKIGREQLDKILYSSKVQQQQKPSPKTNAQNKTRDRSDYSR